MVPCSLRPMNLQNMRNSVRLVTSLSLLTLAPPAIKAADEPSFGGVWKLNPSQSQPMRGILKMEAPEAASTIEILTSTNGAITLSNLDLQSTCAGRFDGKDYPIVIAGTRSKLTLTFERLGSATIKTTMKESGTAVFTDLFILSSDRSTLTHRWTKASSQQFTEVLLEKVERERSATTAAVKTPREGSPVAIAAEVRKTK